MQDAMISSWSGQLLVLRGGKDGVRTISFEHSDIPNPWGFALVDLNGDGRSDFIIADGDSHSAVVYTSHSDRGSSLAVLDGQHPGRE